LLTLNKSPDALIGRSYTEHESEQCAACACVHYVVVENKL